MGELGQGGWKVMLNFTNRWCGERVKLHLTSQGNKNFFYRIVEEGEASSVVCKVITRWCGEEGKLHLTSQENKNFFHRIAEEEAI
jgi:NifU-like protein involved in Fe-S cluster formation